MRQYRSNKLSEAEANAADLVATNTAIPEFPAEDKKYRNQSNVGIRVPWTSNGTLAMRAAKARLEG